MLSVAVGENGAAGAKLSDEGCVYSPTPGDRDQLELFRPLGGESPVASVFSVCRHKPDGPTVLDLFAGIGGLSTGFREAGFRVTGMDHDPWSAAVLSQWSLACPITTDLRNPIEYPSVPVLIGGPPCRPWTVVNQHRRRTAHPDQPLLRCFFEAVLTQKPEIVLMENVLPVSTAEDYAAGWQSLEDAGYSVGAEPVRYSDYGAPTARRRLLTVAVRRSRSGATQFFASLRAHRVSAVTVRQAIGWLRGVERSVVDDHEWPRLGTIEKYAMRYARREYGWYRLNWDQPAPSFPNVAKTYVLHPDAGQDGYQLRVISVREALCIMGFGPHFFFPRGMSLAHRYQMVANAVSPPVARACAEVILEMLGQG